MEDFYSHKNEILYLRNDENIADIKKKKARSSNCFTIPRQKKLIYIPLSI